MASKKLSFEGAFSPIPTPFDEQGMVAHDRFAENIEKWCKTDLAGLLALGSNGEFTYLSEQEKIDVLKTARQAMPDNKMLIAGTGCDSTINTLRLTEQAAAIGADTAMILTPIYFRGKMDGQALLQHYLELADNSPIPVLLYNMPANTGVDIDATTVIRLAEHPNVKGIKDSSGNIIKIGAVLQHTPDDFHFLAGSASFLYPAMVLGASGGVMALSNIAPEQCCQLVKYVKAGLHQEARELQLKLISANTAVTAKFGVAGLKKAMDWAGYYGGPVRSPLRPLNETEESNLRTMLAQSGILADE